MNEISTFAVLDTPIVILSNFANAVTTLINRVSAMFTSFESPQIPEYIEKGQNIQRQMMDILLPDQRDYYSRVNLRLILGLPPVFEEDPEAIKTLEGAISNITTEKVDVTEVIRRMRDY